MNEEQKNELSMVGIEDLNEVAGIIRYDIKKLLELRASALKEVEIAEADCVISAEEYEEIMALHEEAFNEKQYVCESMTEFAVEVPNSHRRDSRIRALRNIMNQFTLDNPETIIDMLYSNLQEYIEEKAILADAAESIINKCCTDFLYCDGLVAALKIIVDRMTPKESYNLRFAIIEAIQKVYETPAPDFSNASEESQEMYEHTREGFFHFVGALFTNELICQDIILRILVDLSQFYPAEPIQIRYLMQVIRTIGSFMEREIATKLTIDEIFRSLSLWQEEKLLPEEYIDDVRALRDLKDAKWVVTIEADKSMLSTVSNEWEKSIAGRRNRGKKEMSEEQAEATRILNELQLFCKNMWVDYVHYFVVEDLEDEVAKFDPEQQITFIQSSYKTLVNHTEMEQRRVSVLIQSLVDKEIIPKESFVSGMEQVISEYAKVHKTNKTAFNAFCNMYFPLIMNKVISLQELIALWRNKDHFDFALVELVFNLMNLWKQVQGEVACKELTDNAIEMKELFVGGCPQIVAEKILAKFGMVEKDGKVYFA